jgi:hypothetical protein
MDALKFEYPDYERFDKGAEGAKRKRVVSILSRQAARMVKEDEKASRKEKTLLSRRLVMLLRRRGRLKVQSRRYPCSRGDSFDASCCRNSRNFKGND